jgi:hypothetical protein
MSIKDCVTYKDYQYELGLSTNKVGFLVDFYLRINTDGDKKSGGRIAGIYKFSHGHPELVLKAMWIASCLNLNGSQFDYIQKMVTTWSKKVIKPEGHAGMEVE